MKNTKQDERTYQYLSSLANFIEVERVTLECFRAQLVKNLSRVIGRKLEDANKANMKIKADAEHFYGENASKINKWKKEGTKEAHE